MAYNLIIIALSSLLLSLSILTDISSHGVAYALSVRRIRSNVYSESIRSRLYMSVVTSPSLKISPRIQKLKETALQKEILNDITASEFALRVEVKQSNDKSLIDFERLIGRLDRDLQLLSTSNVMYEFAPKLIPRLENMKEDLLLVSMNQQPKHIVIEDNLLVPSDDAMSTVTTEKDLSQITKDIRENFRIMVREDGTVDWDGAIASGKQVAKVGTELWERLNGKAEEEGVPSLAELFSPAQAKFPTTAEIDRLTQITAETKREIAEIIRLKDDRKNKLRVDRREGKSIAADDIAQYRRLEVKGKELEKRLKVVTLNLDMEKICAYLYQELEASADPSDQKMLITEVTLIDKQLTSLLSSVQGNANDVATSAIVSASTSDFSSTFGFSDEATTGLLVSLIDDNELNYISNNVQDLKTRLGLDTQMLASMDWGSLGKVASDTLIKIKAGLAFFSEGTNLLLADIQYGWKLTLRAMQGYTLKPREVNALRRTGKDMLTLIPFTIILIIPLSPIGHVLVFSFIQRFFPEFFPSCYTEKRLNLRKLFAEVERKREETSLLMELENETSFFDWSDRVSRLASWVTSSFSPSDSTGSGDSDRGVVENRGSDTSSPTTIAVGGELQEKE